MLIVELERQREIVNDAVNAFDSLIKSYVQFIRKDSNDNIYSDASNNAFYTRTQLEEVSKNISKAIQSQLNAMGTL